MLIFLYGNDSYRSKEKLADHKNKYLQKNDSGSNLSVLDYEDPSSLKSLADVLASQGLFATEKMVIIKNCATQGSLEQQKEVLTFLKNHPELKTDKDLSVIFFEATAPKKNGSLYKFLFTNAQKQEFSPLEGAQLNAWIVDFAKNLSPRAEFPRNAMSLLTAATGNDLHLLSNEITKLVNYADGRAITEADLELLIKSRVDSTMFETIEALVSGNKSLALKLLHAQLAKGEDVYYILSMYTYQIRTLLKIGDFYWQGMTNAPQIAQASGIHPYVVQKSLSQIRSLSLEKTKQMIRDLAKIDTEAKTGKIDPVLALDSFIVSL